MCFEDNFIFPSESGEFIAKNAKYVKIKPERVTKLADEVVDSLKNNGLNDFSYGDDGLHPTSKHSNTSDWIFVIDTLNFCFWSFNNKPKWSVNGHTGYYGLTAAIKRAIDDGYDITNPKFYSNITEDQLKHIMRPDNEETQISLLNTRVKCLHEVGKKLLEKYNGTFENCIKKANFSASNLLKIIVEDFPCFRDEAMFEGRKVSFYKRAQILIADLWSCYNRTGLGKFNDIDCLTMFADYRVPQVLVHFGVLEYDDCLTNLLNKDETLDNESREVIEIRGCSIHAVELVTKEVNRIITSNNLEVELTNSGSIDYFLWLYRRKFAKEVEHIPFHKVLCQYY